MKTSNTQIVATTPTAAAANTFAATIITANTIDQTFIIFFPVYKNHPYW